MMEVRHAKGILPKPYDLFRRSLHASDWYLILDRNEPQLKSSVLQMRSSLHVGKISRRGRLAGPAEKPWYLLSALMLLLELPVSSLLSACHCLLLPKTDTVYLSRSLHLSPRKDR